MLFMVAVIVILNLLMAILLHPWKRCFTAVNPVWLQASGRNVLFQ